MNILLTNYLETLSPGGINKLIRELGRILSEQGHAVTVLQGNPFNLAGEEIYEGFKIIRIASPVEKYLWDLNGRLFFYLKKHLGELDPQVVHLHGHHLNTPEVLYALKRTERSIPTVVDYHIDAYSGTLGRRWFWRAYTKIGTYVANAATHIVAISNFEADYIRQAFGVSDDKISVISLGVDPVFQKKALERDQRNHKGEIRLLSVGYLIRRKDFKSVLYCLNELVHRFGMKEARLTIVGTGPEKGNLLRLADRLDIGEHITWKESLNTPALVREFVEADVFLLLSKSEAYGISVAEALSAGVPSIVTDTTALHDFTKEPGCFGVESPPDPQTVARLILSILENKVEVGPFSSKIRTWERVVQDYEAVYNKVRQDPAPS